MRMEKSDGSYIPMKRLTTVEERILGMNALNEETSGRPTEPHFPTATRLARIAWLSARDRDRRFECLMHHINRETLVACFDELDGKKAVGADGISKEEYGKSLDKNLTDLLERMKRMAYRPGPIRRVLIPKDGKPGATRPLGIAGFEDKLVQKAMAKVLESVYEPIFLNCSYGFRPGRGCHDAIRALHQHLYSQPVSTVLDVDLADYFGSIGIEQLVNILRPKIGDDRFLRYVVRMMKSGILVNGELITSEEGVPQGSPVSPVLANIFAHYVIDEWFENVVKLHCKGKVALFRYADDLCICCESATDAERIKRALTKRLARFGLAINEEKTRLVAFSRWRAGRAERQGSFDFLGFKFYIGKARSGRHIPKLRMSPKRFRTKLKAIRSWARIHRSRMRLPELWREFRQKIAGHIAYYGVSFNGETMQIFVTLARRELFKWLNRRGGKKNLTWEKYEQFEARFPLPRLRIIHSLTVPSRPCK